MERLKFFIMTGILLVGTSCQSNTKKNKAAVPTSHQTEIASLTPQDLSTYETAYFASGCFWCVEAIFESVKGVKEVVSGYAGGTEVDPTYDQVGRGLTHHAEAVEIYYDPNEISFAALVQVFFGSHDPTTLNRQGPDQGAQYRSIAFYKNEKEKKFIEAYIQELTNKDVYNGAAITTEVTPFTKFYDAEDYHQDYERNHPNNSYITNVSIPRLNRFKKNFPAYLKPGVH